MPSTFVRTRASIRDVRAHLLCVMHSSCSAPMQIAELRAHDCALGALLSAGMAGGTGLANVLDVECSSASPSRCAVFHQSVPSTCSIRPKCSTQSRRILMGKYFLAWLLGVPAGLLVLIYVFTHL